jgi:hypothetical protein
MKRGRNEIDKAPLGALEFAATVNGEDVRSLLQVLKRFSKTVRRERRQALLMKNDDESSQDDSESDDSTEHDKELSSKKARKQEKWMEDSKSFNVPFVGTSIAKGDAGTVSSGEWPTGLLQPKNRLKWMCSLLASPTSMPPCRKELHSMVMRSARHLWEHWSLQRL